jgi:hypothetical protein
LLAAVKLHRTDLLPRLLEAGFDPNLRGGGAPSPVDAAIASGAVEELGLLLAGGGRVDTKARDARGAGVLDLAVASGSEAMLRQVDPHLAQRLDRVCLPDTEKLVDIVLQAPDTYWELLRRQGFATDNRACPGLRRRVLKALADAPGRVVAGWLGDNLRTRLPQLGATGAGVAAGDAIWPVAPPQPDAALRTTVPGTYYLRGEREVGSGIRLRPDGTFIYEMSYGNVDEAAHGNWEVRDGHVVLSTAVETASPYVLTTGTGTKPAAGVVVRLGDDRRNMERFEVTLLGDAPVMATGRPQPIGWTARLPGALRQIVLTRTGDRTAPPVVIDVPASLAMEDRFQLDPNRDRKPSMALHVRLQRKGDTLLWERDGRTLRYERAPSPGD